MKEMLYQLTEERNDLQMKIGDTVQHLETGAIGTVHWSSFGFSIHMWTEHEGQRCLAKTLGEPESELLKYWKVVERVDY